MLSFAWDLVRLLLHLLVSALLVLFAELHVAVDSSAANLVMHLHSATIFDPASSFQYLSFKAHVHVLHTATHPVLNPLFFDVRHLVVLGYVQCNCLAVVHFDEDLLLLAAAP